MAVIRWAQGSHNTQALWPQQEHNLMAHIEDSTHTLLTTSQDKQTTDTKCCPVLNTLQ